MPSTLVQCFLFNKLSCDCLQGFLLTDAFFLSDEEVTHAVELVFGACFVSSVKGQTESYTKQHSLGFTSHIWGAREANENLLWKVHNEKNIPPSTIEGKAI